MKVINAPTLGRPSGYANGILAPPGVRVLFVAGQIGWDEQQRLVSEDFAAQFERALRNVLAVVRGAGGAGGPYTPQSRSPPGTSGRIPAPAPGSAPRAARFGPPPAPPRTP